MVHTLATVASILAVLPSSHAFWRLGCGISQRGRIDPIISPGKAAGHMHLMSGAINISPYSDEASLKSANCTSCTIQADKSAYWTPHLYYHFPNGSFTLVPTSGHIIYYLGRGDDAANIVPFPEGYKVVSGDPTARSYDSTNMTYLNARPIADRASFACIDYNNPQKETPGMINTNCPDGLRAQIQFPSCWDGVNAYLPESAHVTYMSQIDNGKCPPTHPKTLPHLFFETYYSVDHFNGQGGQFVFSTGDTTGFGYHGDFMMGWDTDTLNQAVKQCLVGNESGVTEQCPVFKATNDDAASAHCPMAAPVMDEQVDGMLSALPGCNPVTNGPDKAKPPANCTVVATYNGTAPTAMPSGGSAPTVATNAAPAAASTAVSTVTTNVTSAADAAASNVSGLFESMTASIQSALASSSASSSSASAAASAAASPGSAT